MRVCVPTRVCACLRARVRATTPKHLPLLAHRSTLKGVEGRCRGRAVFLPRVGVGKSNAAGGTSSNRCAPAPNRSPRYPCTPATPLPPSPSPPAHVPPRARPPDPPQTPPARRLITAPLHAQRCNDSTSSTSPNFAASNVCVGVGSGEAEGDVVQAKKN